MRERPILFSGPMVRAILAGNKLQTRRPVKGWALEWLQPGMFEPGFVAHPGNAACPYGYAGDRLWVRESTHRRPMLNLLTGEPLAAQYDGGAYTADGADVLTQDGFDLAWWYSRKSCPSIHMPRWACRLVLEITGVRVERLNDISEEDAIAEGIPEESEPCERCGSCGWLCIGGEPQECDAPGCGDGAVDEYRALWEQINGPGTWKANPWVWVVEFRILADTDKKEK